jgi:uncharacterized membrane protein YkoI
MIRYVLFFLLSAVAGIGAETRTAVPFSALPPAVQQTIRKHAGTTPPAEAERVEDDGEVTFDAEIFAGNRARDISVAEDGALLSIEVDFSEMPAAVQRTVRAQIGAGRFVSADKIFDGADSSYDVLMTTPGGQERAFTVEENGAVSSLEVGLAETPPAVQKTVAAQVGAGRLGTIARIFDETTSYDVDFTAADGKEREFSVAADGRLLSTRVTLEETAPEVQKTIREHIGSGKILRIDKSFERRNKTLPYDVEAMKDGKAFNFSVGAAGKFLGMNE